MNFTDRIEHYCQGLHHVSTGTHAKCPECQNLWGMDSAQLEAALEYGEVYDEGGFSWRQCDTCGSSYGGNRYDGHGFTGRNRGRIVHLSICEDCLLYFANGQIPDEEK